MDENITEFLVDLHKDTVSDILRKLSTLEGFVKKKGRLIFDGERLFEESTLASYNIEDGDELVLVMEQSGGMLLFSPC